MRKRGDSALLCCSRKPFGDSISVDGDGSFRWHPVAAPLLRYACKQAGGIRETRRIAPPQHFRDQRFLASGQETETWIEEADMPRSQPIFGRIARIVRSFPAGDGGTYQAEYPREFAILGNEMRRRKFGGRNAVYPGHVCNSLKRDATMTLDHSEAQRIVHKRENPAEAGFLVRSRRLELPRVAPQRPQRCASTNSATTASW